MDKKTLKTVTLFIVGLILGGLYLYWGSFYMVPCSECANQSTYINYKFEPPVKK
jgi:hypothetical protein